MNALAAHLQDSVDSTHGTDARGYQPRQLVLLGAGMANLNVLSALAAKPLAEMRVTLVAPFPRTIYPGMLPGLVAGRYSLEECAIPLEPLVRRAGIRWLQRHVKALDATQQTLQLDDGSSQHYDWLSVNTGPVQNREQLERDIPGAREFGLFAHPLETFAQLWPRVCELAHSKSLRITVIGDHTAALELALAVRQRLAHSAVTLVIQPGEGGVQLDHPVNARLVAAMKAQRITVLQDVAVAIRADAVHLGCGAQLACDVPLIALQSQSPVWLENSGLALDAHGRIATDAYQRSTNHPQVFAVADGNPMLARNLPAAAAGDSLHAAPAGGQALHLLYSGQQAVAGWGSYCATGRPWRWLKDWSDRRHIARYTQHNA
ncbi:FAD-dependent oxidoreductase [Rhodoferax sp.]|uniref:NAD(P)/FAD-dependent oxidoreductase n=1 Tax=Rhodoferax sp. TaxID=50421 RepID=UPI0025D324C2|nr:FAD-dependent oxidoreductase [Rhodoferax sp.]